MKNCHPKGRHREWGDSSSAISTNGGGCTVLCTFYTAEMEGSSYPNRIYLVSLVLEDSGKWSECNLSKRNERERRLILKLFKGRPTCQPDPRELYNFHVGLPHLSIKETLISPWLVTHRWTRPAGIKLQPERAFLMHRTEIITVIARAA